MADPSAPPDETPALGRLRRRPEFLRVAREGRKAARPGLVLQARRQTAADSAGADSAGADQAPLLRVGLTASRKVGGAVVRNRARRRLRALAREKLPALAAPGHDLVLIARQGTVTRDWAALARDLDSALAATGAHLRKAPPQGEGRREKGKREGGKRRGRQPKGRS